MENSIVLQTSKGTDIKNEIYQDEPYFPIKKNDEYHKTRYSEAIYRRRGTRKYNCHGLTFANRRTWIANPDDIFIILKDDEYRKISLNKVVTGDIIVYYKENRIEISHTGIVISVGTFNDMPVPFILSKWAYCGEFIHRYTDCPYFKKKIEFWTDRK